MTSKTDLGRDGTRSKYFIERKLENVTYVTIHFLQRKDGTL
jgi:hypothetical protein